MLCVYSPDCTDFSGNGLGTIAPSSALVKETLNGEYELEIVHPMDETGKWHRLMEGYIVRAPVPSSMTPQVELANKSATSGGMVYKVTTNRDPLRLRSGTGTKYKILGKYKKGTQVIVLAKTTSSWYEVTCPDGKHGYMSASYLTYVKTLPAPSQAAEEVVEARQLRDQPFRIYELQDAVYQRTFELPESFFRKQGSADLAQRLIGFGGIANQIVSLILVNGFMLLMSIIYLIQMFTYSGKLTAAGSAMVAVYALVVYFLSKSTMKYKRSMAEIKYLVWIWKRGFLGIYFKVPVLRTAHVDRQTAKRLGRGFSFEKLMWHDPDETMLKGATA